MRRGRPLQRVSPKQAERQRQWNAITRQKIEDGQTCVDAYLSRCSGPLDGDHDLSRSLGGKWDEENHRLRCRKHHDRKHGKPWHGETAT